MASASTTNAKAAQSGDNTTSVLGTRKASEVEGLGEHQDERPYAKYRPDPDFTFTKTVPASHDEIMACLQQESHKVCSTIKELQKDGALAKYKWSGPAVAIYHLKDDGVSFHIVKEDRYAAKGAPQATVSNVTSRFPAGNKCLLYHAKGASLDVSQLIDPNVLTSALHNGDYVRSEGLSYPMVFLREALKKGKETDTVKELSSSGDVSSVVRFIATVALPRLLKEELLQKMENPEILQTLEPAFFVKSRQRVQPVFFLNRDMLCGDDEAIEIASRMPTLVTPKALPLKGDANVAKLMKFFDGNPDPHYFKFDVKKGHWKVKSDYNEIRGVRIDPYSQNKRLSLDHFHELWDIRLELSRYMQRCFDKGYQLSRWGQHLLFHETVKTFMEESVKAVEE